MSEKSFEENLCNVFTAAEIGDLNSMRQLIHDDHWQVSDVVSTLFRETTLLLIACRKGFPDIVRYLLDECGASVEQAGETSFDGQRFSNVSPLLCAACNGHLGIVKMLIGHGASLSDAADPTFMPLHVAFDNGHHEVFKHLIEEGADIDAFNFLNMTCLMMASHEGNYDIVNFLLQHGANINKQNLRGLTALHYAARSEEIEMCQLLLKYGAQFLADSDGLTAVLLAAFERCVVSVQYFTGSKFCTLTDKVNAIELLGASFVNKCDDLTRGHRYWIRAMVMRYRDKDSPLLKPLSRLPFAQCINTKEVSTLEELEPLIFNFSDMQIQALLIRERILGPTHTHTLWCIHERGFKYWDSHNIDRCITLWMHVLDLWQVGEPLGLYTLYSFLMFRVLFESLVDGLSTTLRQVARRYFDIMLIVFRRATKEIERTMPSVPSKGRNHHLHQMLICAIDVICLMCKFKPYLSNENFEFKQALYSFIHLNPVNDEGSTPLHLACCKLSFSIMLLDRREPLPFLEVIKLLLEVGASPTAVNNDNDTPLHVAALNKPCDETMLKVLLNHGAHLDFRNKKGLTAFQLLDQKDLVEIVPFQHLTLQCLCAQVIRNFNVPFQRQISKELEEFVDHH